MAKHQRPQRTIANKTTKKPTTPQKPDEAASATTVEPKRSSNRARDKKVEISSYWTAERMRAATLHPALKAKKVKQAKKTKLKGAVEKLSKPSLPSKRAVRAAADAWIYETSLVPDVRDFPASTIGKIYLTWGENDYYATGWVVGNTTVFTLASVLFDRESKQWASNVVFYPQYNNGPGAGLGPFSITELWIAANWDEKGEFLNNFGAIITSVPISPFTGSLGLMANAPANQGQYLIMGYPGPSSGYPFDGERMWQSTSAYLGDFNWIVQAGSNLTYGAHGAPWLIFREGGWYANGIFAGRVVNPDSLLSPYFGNEVWDFFTYLRNRGYI